MACAERPAAKLRKLSSSVGLVNFPFTTALRGSQQQARAVVETFAQ